MRLQAAHHTSSVTLTLSSFDTLSAVDFTSADGNCNPATRPPTIGLQDHTCDGHDGSTDDENETTNERCQDESVASLLLRRKEHEFEGADATPCTGEEDTMNTPLMGHGLVTYRAQTLLDPVVKEILEVQYQMGVAKSSARKGVLEMVEACKDKVPAFMSPSIETGSSWLSSRLSKEAKKPADGTSTTSSRASRREPTSEADKRQKDAQVIPRTFAQLIGVNIESKKRLFLAKYRGVTFLKGDIVWLVSSVNFVDGAWKLVASRAKQNPYDDRFYIRDTILSQGITVPIKGGRDGIRTLVKAFNVSRG
jgi:hypothetical protein